MANALLTCCFLSASLLTASALAEEPYRTNPYSHNANPSNPNNPNNNVYTGWSWSGHVEHIAIDEQAAAEQYIEDTATAIGGAAEYYSSATANSLVLGMNFLFYRDNAAFGQFIHDYWGDVNYTESDAGAFMLFAEYGPKYRFGQDNMSFVTVRGGVSGMLYSERAISYCSDCYSEDIDIDGGVYGVLGIGQTLGSLDISLQFQQYFSGDLDNSIRLKIAGAF